MTEATTHPAPAETPGQPVTAATVPDARTLRQVARAEQDRLTADAALERRAREAELDLQLREQQRAAARRERHAKAADKQARRQQRQQQRAARRARLRAAAPRWADRTLFVLPIMFPMAVAWIGQIRFAMTVMGWPLPAAIVFAAGFELSTAYVARLDWLSRAAGDSGLLFRAATWGFATGAATMNYWHAAGPGFTPNGEAVSYGLMSITGILLWELLSTYRHRTALRAHGKRPAARPRFGLARWIWFHRLTRLAWLLTLRDGHTTTDSAWRAALTAIERYGCAKQARKAIRAGRPVPLPTPRDDDRDDADDATTGHRDVHPGAAQRDTETPTHDRDNTDETTGRDSLGRDEQRDTGTRDGHHGTAVRDAAEHPDADGQPPAADRHLSDDGHPTPDEQPDQGQAGSAAADAGRDDEGDNDGPGEHALSVRMLAYARQRFADGATVTGADLDRHFGTRDYGRRILRRLANEPPTGATTGEPAATRAA